MFKLTLSLTNKQGEKGRSAPFLVWFSKSSVIMLLPHWPS